MSLVPRNRFFDLDSFFEPSMFGSSWPTQGEAGDVKAFSPRVDIKEVKDHFEITAELPGVKKSDIHIHLENGILSLKAETKAENKEEDEQGRIIRQERRYGTFFRSFDVGNQVHENDINAEFNDGVLKIVAPRVDVEKPEVKKISIR